MGVCVIAFLAAYVSRGDDPPAGSGIVKEQIEKRRSNASFYIVTWDPKPKATKLRVTTVSWQAKGQIVLSNGDDTAGGQEHHNPDAKTKSVDINLDENEQKWVAEGKIHIYIRNDHDYEHGAEDVLPSITEVVAVP
jgi:hypothetical protein